MKRENLKTPQGNYTKNISKEQGILKTGVQHHFCLKHCREAFTFESTLDLCHVLYYRGLPALTTFTWDAFWFSPHATSTRLRSSCLRPLSGRMPTTSSAFGALPTSCASLYLCGCDSRYVTRGAPGTKQFGHSKHQN